MLTIILYNMSAEDNRVDKSSALAEDFTIMANLKYPTSVTDPILEIRDSVEMPKAIFMYNYAYIKEFKRYYFIRDMRTITNGVWEVFMHIDVLMSHVDEIKNTVAYIGRQEFEYDLNYDDSDIPIFFPATQYAIGYGAAGLPFETSKDAIDQENNFQNVMLFCINNRPDEVPLLTNGERNLSLKSPTSYYSPVTPSTSCYIMGYEQILGLTKEFAPDSAVMSAIQSITVFPFSLQSLFDSTYLTKPNEVIINDQGYAVELLNGNVYKVISGAVSKPITSAPIKISRRSAPFTGTYLDFSPYTSMNLWVPLYGYRELDPNLVFTQNADDDIELYLQYVIDMYSGSADIYITRTLNGEGVGLLIDSFSTDIGAQIPPNSLSLADRDRLNSANSLVAETSKTNSIWKAVIGAFSSGASAAVGFATGNFNAGMNGVGNVAGAIMGGATEVGMADAEYKASKITNVSRGQISSVNGNGFNIFTAPMQVDLVIIKNVSSILEHNKDSQDFKDFAHLHGFTSNIIKRLGECTGYTRVTDCNLENFPNTYRSELSEIRQRLLSGVIL